MSRKKSDRAKLLVGSFRPDRAVNEPKPESGIPKIPSGLTRGAHKYYKQLIVRLSSMNAIFKVDDLGLMLCAEALEEFVRLKQVTIKKGDTYECMTKSGDIMIRVRPEKILAEKAWHRALTGLKEYGLTLCSRNRIDIVPEPNEPNPWAEL